MKYIILAILVNIISSVKGQSHINIYDSVFNQKKLIKDSKTYKELFAKYLSSNEDPIKASNIDTVIMKQGIYIKNYGSADLITVILSKTTAKVLSSKFLVVVNHSTKTLSYINIDDYYLIKTSALDRGVQIMTMRNFRGNIELSIYNFSKDQFSPIFLKNIYKSTDCDQYKFGTLNVNNIDLNNDGKLDLVINYKINHFCDKDGSESNSPLYEIKQSNQLIFSPKGKIENWTLK
ncbi:hypothetical protein ACJVDH_05825 [Pedobacter sp. AW1-32]|uniref:hypothetical protein n=1 Tax=Pedobacter sp. AW1-32 TaxID=3383026 RepID=UPI003FEE4FC7